MLALFALMLFLQRSADANTEESQPVASSALPNEHDQRVASPAGLPSYLTRSSYHEEPEDGGKNKDEKRRIAREMLEEQSMDADYKRLQRRFEHAVACGRKYGWDKPKVVDKLQQIEAKLERSGTAAEHRPAAALDLVVAMIKTEKLEARSQARALYKVIKTMQKDESGVALQESVTTWATRSMHAVEASKAEGGPQEMVKLVQENELLEARLRAAEERERAIGKQLEIAQQSAHNFEAATAAKATEAAAAKNAYIAAVKKKAEEAASKRAAAAKPPAARSRYHCIRS